MGVPARSARRVCDANAHCVARSERPSRPSHCFAFSRAMRSFPSLFYFYQLRTLSLLRNERTSFHSPRSFVWSFFSRPSFLLSGRARATPPNICYVISHTGFHALFFKTSNPGSSWQLTSCKTIAISWHLHARFGLSLSISIRPSVLFLFYSFFSTGF